MKDLRTIIAEEIRRRGPIPFSRYMELCLYHPELGYYSRTREQFGKAGDFYTSSDVHAVFGRLLARQFDEMWRAMDSPSRVDIVELGPGRGLFAQDVLDWAKKKFPDFLEALHYTMVESSPGLRNRLKERFAGCKAVRIVGSVDEVTDATHICQKQADVGHLPPDEGCQPENVIVFGNEFFDAFPVEVISRNGKLHIGVEGDRFMETFAPAASCELEFLDRYGVHPDEGERAEVTLPALEYVKRIAGLVRRGFAVFIDYGYTREELLAGRQKSTVRAFRQHTLCNTPYEAPGDQDITANVNFTALHDTALTAGFEQASILTQAEFLMGIGESTQFSDAFEDTRLPQEQVKVGMQLKHLITPEGMGEVFRVLLLSKGVEKEKAAGISGLTFARHS